MSNRLTSLAILLCIGIFFYVFAVYGLNISCVIKSITKLECPACGMTRAFRCLINLDIINSIKFNILCIPIAVFLIVSIFLLLYDLLFAKRIFLDSLMKILNNHYIIIIVSLAISMLYNNIK